MLRTGDVFHEPADTRIDRFDALGGSATFLAYFLSAPGGAPTLTLEP